MRIVFMGTPEFAVASLDALVKKGFDIAAVVTVPDKPAGRGQQLTESAVKKYAVAHHLKVLQPEKLKSPEFLEQLQSLQADLFIVVAFRMLPEVVWQMPPKGTFNLHGSLLPKYRGAAPINRAVMNGETETGVTTFFLKHEIDTGAIIFNERIPIGPDETAGELHDRMMMIGADLVVKTVEAIERNDVKPIPQEELISDVAMLPHAPKIFREDCRINWTKSCEEIHNHIRGLSPYPAAWSEMKSADGKTTVIKIFRSAYHKLPHSFAPGSIHDQFRVAANDGFIEVLELQAAGKKRMTTAEFLRGFKVSEGDHFIPD